MQLYRISTLWLAIAMVLGLMLAGCGPSKQDQAREAAQAEIRQSLVQDADAIRARLAQLGRVADLLQKPVETGSSRQTAACLVPYPEFFTGAERGGDTKMAGPAETMERVAIVRWNELDAFSAAGARNEPADDLNFLCRPLGLAYDVGKLHKALADPSVFDRASEYRRLRALLLETRYLVAVKQIEYRDAKLDLGFQAKEFTPGRVAFSAALVDIEVPAVMAMWTAEATNSDEIGTRYSYKRRADSNVQEDAFRKAAEKGLQDDLRKRAFEVLEGRIRGLIVGPGTFGPAGKAAQSNASSASHSDEKPGAAITPSPDEKVSEPAPDAKIP